MTETGYLGLSRQPGGHYHRHRRHHGWWCLLLLLAAGAVAWLVAGRGSL